MKELIFAFVLFILGIVHFTILYNHHVRKRTVGVFSMVFFILLLYYEIIPIIFFCSNVDKLASKELLVRECSIEQFLLAELCIIIFSFVFYVTYHRYNRIRNNVSYEVNEEKLDKWLLRLGLISFFIGSLAFFIYVSAFGGISAWYSKANIIRSFAYSSDKYISHFASIMVIPAKMLLASPLLLHAVMLKKRKIWLRIVFIISVVLSFIFLLGNAGKTDIIIFLLCFAIPFFKRFMRHPWRFTIVTGIIGIPCLELLDAVFDYITYGQWVVEETNILYTLRQFAYPYCDVLYMSDIVNKFGLRWGKDFITGVLNVVPGLNFEASYIPVSAFFGGESWTFNGGTPNEIITFGYQQLGIIGVVLIAIIFGIICGKIDKVVETISFDNIYAVFTTAIIMNMFTYMLNADIYGLVSTQFALVLPAFCALYACRVKET